MKPIISIVLFLFGITFVSCDGRTGYLEENQIITIEVLTGNEWLLSYYDNGYGDEYEYDNDTRIYRFEKSGTGWIANGSFSDASKVEDVSYFQWTFTTENFAVLYLAGYIIEEYWLIEKFTPYELWVKGAPKDPVIYPNQDMRIYHFKARKIELSS